MNTEDRFECFRCGCVRAYFGMTNGTAFAFMRWVARLLALVVVTLTLTVSPSQAALNHNTASIKSMSKAYGFVYGQDYSLSRIEKTFPVMRLQVETARAAFGSGFPDIKVKLEKELSLAIGEANVRKFRTELETKIKGLLVQQTLTMATAQQFLEQVKARGKGNEMEADVLNYLLAVRYTANPVGEFRDGFRQRYGTDGSGKSQGIKLHLQLPRSWLANEGERPHVVQKWVNEGGTGLSNIMLLVQDAQGPAPTRRELDQFVKSGEIREAVPDGATYLDGGALAQEKSVGYWMEMTMPQERAAMKMYIRGFMYLLFFRGKGIVVMCMAGGPEQNRAVADVESVKLKPLCQQVMNSLVLEQAY